MVVRSTSAASETPLALSQPALKSFQKSYHQLTSRVKFKHLTECSVTRVTLCAGPSHMGWNCGAAIITDHSNRHGRGTIVYQPSYYYTGHFSRWLEPGMTVVEVREWARHLATPNFNNPTISLHMPLNGAHKSSTRVQAGNIDERYPQGAQTVVLGAHSPHTRRKLL
jgi:hypothetical protein